VSGDLGPKTLIMMHLEALGGVARVIGRVRGNVMGDMPQCGGIPLTTPAVPD